MSESKNPIEVLVERIISYKKDEADLAEQIKYEYALINSRLQHSGGVITKEVDSIYKNIDRLFGLKQERIVSITNAKRKIQELQGIL